MTTQENHIAGDLLNRIAEGDETAFRTLYDQFHKQVYNQAYNYLQDPGLASDAVQNVFVKIWMVRDKLREVKNPRNYIFIVARNIIISDLRKKVFHKYLDEELAMLEEDTKLPDKQLSLKESMEIIHKAIENLSPQQKKAYTLSRTNGLSIEEISKEMEISQETVKTHIKQSLKSLRKYLSDHSIDLALLIVFILRNR